MGPLLEQYVDALREALPCGSRAEIYQNMSRILGRRSLPPSAVGYALGYVRRNQDELAWTVPHANSSPTSEETEGRFFVLPARRTRDFGILDEDRRAHIDAGTLTTIISAERRLTNLAGILEMALEHENLRVHREYLRDTAEMVQTASRRLVRVRALVLEKIDEDAA